MQKGIDILIDVINNLSTELQLGIVFHIMGDGSFRKKIEQVEKAKDFVHYYGPVSNLSNKLGDFDLMIMPSRFEGFPLVSVEASLSRVPVVAARSPGLKESLPEDWPLFIPELNATEFIRKLTELYNKKIDIQKLKVEAYEHVVRNFSIERMMMLYQKAYQES